MSKSFLLMQLQHVFPQLSGPVKFSENLDSKWQEGWHSDTNWNVKPAKEHICLKFLLRCPLFQWYHKLIQSVFEIRKVAFFNHSMVYHTSKYQSSSMKRQMKQLIKFWLNLAVCMNAGYSGQIGCCTWSKKYNLFCFYLSS